MEGFVKLSASWKEQLATRMGQQPDNWRFLASVAVLLLAVLYAIFFAVDYIYKLYLHPLAKFPGPTAACLSKRWLLRVSRGGRAEELFEDLHKKYNTKALRIAPNELHINDVTLYKTIYSQTSTYIKDQAFYGGFGTPHTVFAEDDPILHKERRRLLNPFFSRGAIVKLEALVKGKVAELGTRIDRQPGPYNIYNAIRCTTVDIISQYCTGRPIGQLANTDENFYGGFLVTFDAVAKGLWSLIYQPNLRRLLSMIPGPIAAAMSKDVAHIFMLTNTCLKAGQKYKEAPPKSDHPIVFSALTHLSDENLAAEAVDLLVAGSDTTAFSLTVAIANMSRHPDIKERLVAALKAQIRNVDQLPSLTDLENIPYLNACVRESIRVASPVPGRLPRVVPKGTPFVVDGQIVPEGTVVGLSAYTMHHDRQLWGDDAASFNPDRWLTEKGKTLDQHMVSFSKGSRSCLGQNLAYAESHIFLAYLFRKYDVQMTAEATTEHALDSFTYIIPDHGLMVDLKPY